MGRGLPSLTLTGLPGAAVRDACDRIRPAVEGSGLRWPLRRVIGQPRARQPPQGRSRASTCRSPWASSPPPRRCPRLARPVRVLGRALAEGRAHAHARHPLGRHRGRPPAASTGSSCPAANAREAAQVDGLAVVGRRDAHRGRRASSEAPGSHPIGRVRRRRGAEPHGRLRRRAGPDTRPVARSRSRPPAGTTCCWSARPGRARPCSLAASPRSCPSSPARRRSRRPSCTRWPGCSRGRRGPAVPAVPGAAPFHLACRPARAAAPRTCARARSRSPTTASCSSTSSPSSGAMPSKGLRQPLEDGRVVVTRAVGSVEFPARFTLVAAANPCPCGFEGDPRRHCRCRSDRAEQYRQKLSGPLLDRIDLRLRVPRLTKARAHGRRARRALGDHPRPGAGGPRPPTRTLGLVSASRATRTCRARSRAGRCACTREAERLLGSRRRRARAHRPRVRPGAQGRAHDRGSRRRRGRSRPTTWPRPCPIETGSRAKGWPMPGDARPETHRRATPALDVPPGFPEGFASGPQAREALLVLASLRGITPYARSTSSRGPRARPRRCLEAIRAGAAGSENDRDFARAARSGRDRARRVSRLGARFVTPADDEYVPVVPRSAARPAGRRSSCAGVRSPSSPTASVVGARNCSPLGNEIAMSSGPALARWAAASSAAPPAASTRRRTGGARRWAGPSIAVLGSGIDLPYPKGSASSSSASRPSGAVVSEYAPGRRGRAVPVPRAQPAGGRARQGAGRGRGRRRQRVHDLGRPCHRPRARRVRGARPGHEPARRGAARPDPRRARP